MRFTGFSGSGGGCGCCEESPFVLCGSCGIPKQDLTLSWTDGVTSGTVTLVFNGVADWQSACGGVGNSNLFELRCNAGVVELIVTYFISGACPTGQRGTCSTLGSNPHKLTQTGLTCGDSFLMTVTVDATGCPQISDLYTDFTVSV